MILQRKNRLTIIDFFSLLKNVNYSRKDGNALDSVPMDYNCTWLFFQKYQNCFGELNKDMSKSIKDALDNLETKAEEIFSRNNLGKMDPWVLFTIYLEEVNKKPVISFGFEHKKTKKVLSFSIPLKS